MKWFNISKILGLAICNLFVFLIVSVVFAVDGKSLTVKSISRISHPAYDMANVFQGSRNPFNVDYSRILMDEMGIRSGETYAIIYHPNFPSSYPNARNYGRQMIWGCISDSCVNSTPATSTLQNLNLENASGNSSLIAWDSNTFSLRSAYDGKERSTIWSPYPGEVNIIYTLNKNTNMLVAYNVDTQIETPIISYGNYPDAQIKGFAKNAAISNDPNEDIILIDLVYTNNAHGDGLKIDTKRRYGFVGATSTPITLAYGCNDQFTWGPDEHGNHSSHNPNGKYYWQSTPKYMNSCTTGKKWTPNLNNAWPEYTQCHLSWLADSDWFIGSSGGIYVGDLPYPNLYPHKIQQVIFDSNYAEANCPNNSACQEAFTRIPLITYQSANYWANGAYEVNYHNLPSVTVSPNGQYLYYAGTNGKYTRDDYSCTLNPSACGHTSQSIAPATADIVNKGWEGKGTYIAELEYASGAQACTSFTYSAWSECQNNTQTRTVTSSSPTGCTGGNPILTQSCNNPSASYTIYKTAMSPTIDGNLFEYTSANVISYSPATGGNTVTVRALRNTEALLVGITVTDSQLNASITSRDGSVWNEDSIEWFIDTLNNGGSNDPNTAYMLPDDYHGIINVLNTQYDSRGSISGVPSSAWNGSWQSYVKINGTINNNADIDNGYTIEIKIPWTSLGYTSAPSDNTTVRFSIAINDKDASGITSLMWPNITAAAENASNWQSVLLSGSYATIDTVAPAPPVALMIQ